MNDKIKLKLFLFLLTTVNIYALQNITEDVYDAPQAQLPEDSYDELTIIEKEAELPEDTSIEFKLIQTAAETSTILPFDAHLSQKMDYCNIPQCLNLKHIACNNTGNFGPRCPKKVHLLDINLYKKSIVNWHNRRRNEIAIGKMMILPALQMFELQWDDELAYLAKLFVIGCESYKQKCHITNTFRQTGINVGIFNYNGYTADISERQLLKKKIYSWYHSWNEDTTKLIDIYKSENYFGTTQLLVADQNTHIGCAAIIWEKNFGHTFLLVCVYGYISLQMPLNEILANNAILSCKNGKSVKYAYLCRTEEPFDVNINWLEDANALYNY